MAVGKSIIRVDACEKVTGGAQYTADLEPKGALVAKVVRSTIANGDVKGFDLEAALAVPGVVTTSSPPRATPGPWRRPIRTSRTGSF